MTPKECKTVSAAMAAAGAVFEARIAAAKVTGNPDSRVDRALYALEHKFLARADELAAAKQKRRKR